ncbi:MAG TPA: DUF1569 domain-containing protein [Vicinamibacterales bacterium]|nr:DUF1569 domain-containing protein [Vicinamibacterales bacterium]
MYPHRSLRDHANVDELVQRLSKLAADSPRHWGTMTAHQMVCHLSDAFLTVLGERQASSKETWMSRTVVKYIALHTKLPWPHGVPTMPEVDQKIGGTKPVEFERDRQKTLDLLRRFVRPDTRYGRHPGFGAMTRDEWMLWGYGHLDHHLRQFGV